jgi:hypothetical protein
MEARIAKLVVFGGGGDTVHCGAGVTITGYGRPDNPHAACVKDDRIIPDGTPAIDIRAAIETDGGYSWVFEGPMVDVDLADGQVDQCPEPSEIFAEAVAGNPFGRLLAIQEAQRARKVRAGSLDSVSIAEYVAGWRKHGARIGEYRAGSIVWTEAD